MDFASPQRSEKCS